MGRTTINGKQVTDDSIELGVDTFGTLPISEGGTNASTAASARTNLGTQAKSFITVGSSDADYITDGTADDVQIQQAVDDLTTNGIVRIKKGTYAITASIEIPEGKGITLEGEGWETILHAENSLDDYVIKFVPGSTGVWGKIANFKIEANAENQTAGGGIWAKGSIQSVFEHLWINKPYAIGLYLHEITSGSLGHHNRVVKCLFDGGTSSAGAGIGLKIEASDESYITKNDFENNKTHFVDTSGDNAFINNSIVAGGIGVRVENAPRTRVIGNVFDHPNKHAINLVGTHNIAIGNTIFGPGNDTANTYSGIYLEFGGEKNVIIGNTIKSHPTDGVTRSFIRDDSSGNNTIIGNQALIDGDLGTGAYEGTATDNVIIGNKGLTDNILDGYLALKEGSAPSALNGYGKLYVKSADGKLYYKDDGGTEYDLTAAATTPAGSDSQMQYNNGGAFGAATAWYDDVNNKYAFGAENYDRTFNFTGDGFLVRSADNTKGFRARFGGATDFESTRDLYFSTWSGDGFSGSQYTQFILKGDGAPTEWRRSITFNSDADAGVNYQFKGDTDDNTLYVKSSNNSVGIGTNDPSAKLDVNSDVIRLRTAKTPASATATGNRGDICTDANYIYICTATNTWKRAALSTW